MKPDFTKGDSAELRATICAEILESFFSRHDRLDKRHLTEAHEDAMETLEDLHMILMYGAIEGDLDEG